MCVCVCVCVCVCEYMCVYIYIYIFFFCDRSYRIINILYHTVILCDINCVILLPYHENVSAHIYIYIYNFWLHFLF